MRQRIITAVIAVAILIPFLIYSRTAAFLVLICFLSVVSAYELLGCVGLKKNLFAAIPTYALALSVSLFTRCGGYGNESFITAVFFHYFIYIMILFSVAVFSKGKIKFDDAAVLTVMMIYVTFGFAALIRLRDMEHGTLLYLMALVMPWVSDTFAYFSGWIFGKHKLIPDVSPKKTVEGAVGAIVCSAAAGIIYGVVCTTVLDVSVNYILIGTIGALISLVAQCGDLIMSMVKRNYGIKDYGIILPGHGGILDRFDSTIAVTSLVYIFYLIFPFFGSSMLNLSI